VNDQILRFGDIALQVPIKNIFFLVYMKEKPTYISSLLEAAGQDYVLFQNGTKKWNGSNYAKR